MSGARKCTLEDDDSATVDLGINVGLPVAYALAESVLACVLTAVTRLSCATNVEAYSARSSHSSGAWTRSIKMSTLVSSVYDSTLRCEGRNYWIQWQHDRQCVPARHQAVSAHARCAPKGMGEGFDTIRCKDSEQQDDCHPTKSYVHDQVGNNTEAFASHVKESAANTSELFAPTACTLLE